MSSPVPVPRPSEPRAKCAHRRIDYRKEDYKYDGPDVPNPDPDSPHVGLRHGATLTRDWWECCDCKTKFAPVPSVPTAIQGMGYPAAARVVHLWLKEFCDESLPFSDMIAQASRLAGAQIGQLRADKLNLLAAREPQRVASSGEAANSTQRDALAAVVESIAARKAAEAEQDAAGREGRLQNNSQCPSWNRYVEAQAKVWPALEKWAARVQGESSQC